MVKEEQWDGLRVQADTGGAPTWHEEALAERLRRLDSGKEPTSPWAEAKERIRRRVKAE